MVKLLDILKIHVILILLLTLSPLLSSGETQAAVVLEEMKVAREAAERRAIQLEAEVSRLKKDLDRFGQATRTSTWRAIQALAAPADGVAGGADAAPEGRRRA